MMIMMVKVVWSAAEDGTVMQWDVRERYQPGEANILVNLVKHTGRAAECKCIAICPTRYVPLQYLYA